jgi:hypothetical protein
MHSWIFRCASCRQHRQQIVNSRKESLVYFSLVGDSNRETGLSTWRVKAFNRKLILTGYANDYEIISSLRFEFDISRIVMVKWFLMELVIG